MIKNYQIPEGHHEGLSLLVCIAVLASSMYVSEIKGTYWWMALGFIVMFACLNVSLSKSQQILEDYRQSYIQNLDKKETSDLTQALEDPKTTETTRKFIILYLNSYRAGWSSNPVPGM